MKIRLEFVLCAFGLLTAGLGAWLLRPSPHVTKYTVAPDGKVAILVSCDEASVCFQNAAFDCPSGYEVLGQNTVIGRDSSVTQVGDSTVSSPVPSFSGSWLMRCRTK